MITVLKLHDPKLRAFFTTDPPVWQTDRRTGDSTIVAYMLSSATSSEGSY